PVEIRLVHLPCRACQGRPYRTCLLKGKVRIQAEPEIVCAGVTICRQNEKRHHANAKRRKQSPFPEHRTVPFQLPALPLPRHVIQARPLLPCACRNIRQRPRFSSYMSRAQGLHETRSKAPAATWE